jgi:hypothetical protein
VLLLPARGVLAADAPDWVVKGSFKDGPRVVAVGSGRGLEAALLGALTQAAGLLGSKGAEYEREFGPITLKHKSADNLSSSKPGEAQVVKSTTQLRLARGQKSVALILKELTETGARTRETSELTVEAEELGLADLLSVLADQGYVFKEWRDPADYTQFVALDRGGPKEKK